MDKREEEAYLKESINLKSKKLINKINNTKDCRLRIFSQRKKTEITLKPETLNTSNCIAI